MRNQHIKSYNLMYVTEDGAVGCDIVHDDLEIIMKRIANLIKNPEPFCKIRKFTVTKGSKIHYSKIILKNECKTLV
jgi:hypothetical protein